MAVMTKELIRSKEVLQENSKPISVLPIYKAGIIGCGWIAIEAPDSHLMAYKNNRRTTLISLCDSDAEKRRTLVGLSEIWDNYKTMVKADSLDIVSICTPVETHCQIVCDVAPYVKAIWCEKPIAISLGEANRMIETCHKYKVILQVNHQRKFSVPVFRYSRGILNTGTHMFDLLRQLFGEAEVITKDRVLFGKTWIKIEKVDTDKAVFEFDCTHNGDKMLPKALEHLIDCLDNGHESISSGEEARETLRLTLNYGRMIGEEI